MKSEVKKEEEGREDGQVSLASCDWTGGDQKEGERGVESLFWRQSGEEKKRRRGETFIYSGRKLFWSWRINVSSVVHSSSDLEISYSFLSPLSVSYVMTFFSTLSFL